MTFTRVAGIAVLFVVAHAIPANAEEGAFYGPLRSRDLSPFGFLRLDMRPAHAVSIEPELGDRNRAWATRTPGR